MVSHSVLVPYRDEAPYAPVKNLKKKNEKRKTNDSKNGLPHRVKRVAVV